MLPKSTIPASPVSSHALLIPQAIIHQQAQHSERRIRFLLIVAIISAVLFAIVQPASAQFNLNNKKILKATVHTGNSSVKSLPAIISYVHNSL